MSFRNKEDLERRKGEYRNIFNALLKSEDLSEIKEIANSLNDVCDKIFGRASVAEDRINELEEFAPQTINFKCCQCNYETQFSMPGSNWFRKIIYDNLKS